MKFLVALMKSSGILTAPVGIFVGAMIANQLDSGDIQIDDLINAVVMGLVVAGVQLVFVSNRRR